MSSNGAITAGTTTVNKSGGYLGLAGHSSVYNLVVNPNNLIDSSPDTGVTSYNLAVNSNFVNNGGPNAFISRAGTFAINNYRIPQTIKTGGVTFNNINLTSDTDGNSSLFTDSFNLNGDLNGYGYSCWGGYHTWKASVPIIINITGNLNLNGTGDGYSGCWGGMYFGQNMTINMTGNNKSFNVAGVSGTVWVNADFNFNGTGVTTVSTNGSSWQSGTVTVNQAYGPINLVGNSNFNNVNIKSGNVLNSNNSVLTSTVYGPSNGLVGYWRMDENTNNVPIIDYSSNGNPAVPFSAPTYTASVAAGIRFPNPSGMYFNGSNFAEVQNTGVVDPQQITVSTWFSIPSYPADGADCRHWLVGKGGNEQTEGHYGLVINGCSAGASQVGTYFDIGGGALNSYAVWSSTGVISLNTWYHLAATYDNSILKLYLNGTLVGSLTINKARTSSPSNLVFGRRPDAWRNTVASLDDVRIYSRALSAAEITSLATSDLSASSSVSMYNSLSTAGTFTNSGTFNGGNSTTTVDTFTGNLTNSGSFTASAGTTTLLGNFIMNGGSFSHNNGIFNFGNSGADQTITTGQDLTFNNLYKVLTGTYHMLTFNSGFTYNVLGTATLQGNGTANKLYLNPSLNGTPWSFNPSGIRSFANLAPWYSNNTNATPISALNSASSSNTAMPGDCGSAFSFCDRGFNVNWNFGSGPKAFWVGSGSGAGALVSAANWASSTGGIAGSAVVGPTYQLFFDGGGRTNATFDASSGGTYAGIYMDSAYTGTVTQAKPLTIQSQGFIQNGGTFNGSTDAFSTAGLTLAGGTFNSPLNATDTGAFTVSGGTFNASSTLNVAGTLADNTTASSSGGTGPVGWWKLDEGTPGASVVDSSGNGNTGTQSGSPTYTSSVPGAVNFTDPYAMTFNGTSQYVSIGPMFTGVNNFSVSFWAKVHNPTTQDAQTAIQIGDSSSNSRGWGIRTRTSSTAGHWQIVHSGVAGYLETTAVASNDVWAHYVMVVSGGTTSFYQNGSAVSVTNNTNVINAPLSTDVGYIGNLGGNYFNGSIDDVRIYNRALSQAEITSLAPSYVGYWKFDEGSGASATDWSGFGNTGTLVAAPTWTGSSGVAPVSFTDSNAVTFNGTTQYADLGNGSSINFAGANPFSLSLWYKSAISPGTGLHLIGKRTGCAGSAIQYQIADATVPNGGIAFYEWDGTGAHSLSSNIQATVGSWTHIAFTYTGTVGTIYVNGAPANSASLTFTNNTVATDLMVGESGTCAKANGSIDDVRIYNRALSATEVSQLAQGQNVNPGGQSNTSGVISGSFNPATSTVNLTGGSQSLTSMGTTTFYNLVKNVVSNATLTFSSGKVFQVLNNLTLSGGANQYLNLRSSSAGTQWKILINPAVLPTLNLLSVQDSNNITMNNGTSSPIVAAGGIDNGNNLNWLFSIPGTTINWSGTQVATTTISTTSPITNMVGGAFTATRSSSGPELYITGITFLQNGSLSNSYISNMRLYYKQVSGSCDTGLIYNSGVMLGGFGPATYLNGRYTFSTSTSQLAATSLPVDFGTTTCLYLRYDLPATSTIPTSLAGQSIDPIIVNPLTDVIMNQGNASPSSVIDIQGANRATVIDGNSLGLGNVLSIATAATSTNPTTFYVQSGALWMHQGTSTPPAAIQLTPSNITATGFSFIKSAPSAGSQVVKITLNLSETDPRNPQKPSYAKTMTFTATVRVGH